MRNIIAILTISLMACGVAEACYVPKPENFRPHDAIIREARSILLVEVQVGNTCTFKVSRVLKGSAADINEAHCQAATPKDWSTDFNKHTSSEFWKERGGRLGIEPTCAVMAPTFEVGGFYLIFVGADPDTKLYEKVSPEDHWLLFVEKQLSGAHGSNPSLKADVPDGPRL